MAPRSGVAGVLAGLAILLVAAPGIRSQAPPTDAAADSLAGRAAGPSGLVPFDVVLEGGRIVDGTGNAWYHGDLAIRGDRIAGIGAPGSFSDHPASRRIDVTGLVVSPGFIDIQSHSRYALLYGDSRVISKVTQGVTTEILGEGTTDAPLNPARVSFDAIPDSLQRAHARRFSGTDGFGEWLRALDERRSSVNVGSFLGGSTLRVYARGFRSGPPTPAEMDTLRAVTRRAMENGAFGVATALVYPPGSFATTDELVEVARAMAPYGGVYITHLRSEGDRLLEAVDEALEIGERGGVPVEIFHLKAAGRRNWSKAGAVVRAIDGARARGIDVQATIYPYAGASTSLSACIPPWVSEGGRLEQNLRDRETRRRVIGEMLGDAGDWENFCRLATPEGVLLLGLSRPENRQWVGMRLSEVARATDRQWADVVVDLVLSEQGSISTVYFLMSEATVRRFMEQPWIKFGTDAGGVNPRAGLGLIHPRAYGTYPRVLGTYVREEGVLSLEEAVRKSTSAVATRLSIPERGLLREGYFADVAVFDPATVGDRATYTDPHRPSEGVRHVFVNGVAVLEEGGHTGARPGRILRGPGARADTQEEEPTTGR